MGRHAAALVAVMRRLLRSRTAEPSRTHKYDLLLRAADAARAEARNAAPGSPIHQVHLDMAEVLEKAADAHRDNFGFPSDADERGWALFRIARAYLNTPLVSPYD